MIDYYSKPLECKAGPVQLMAVDTSPAGQVRVIVHDVVFNVYVESGKPVKDAIVSEDMCTVRNKKSNRDKAIEVAMYAVTHRGIDRGDCRGSHERIVDGLIEAGLITGD